jgi:hypothetical protein
MSRWRMVSRMGSANTPLHEYAPKWSGIENFGAYETGGTL